MVTFGDDDVPTMNESALLGWSGSYEERSSGSDEDDEDDEQSLSNVNAKYVEGSVVLFSSWRPIRCHFPGTSILAKLVNEFLLGGILGLLLQRCFEISHIAELHNNVRISMAVTIPTRKIRLTDLILSQAILVACITKRGRCT